jgi:hypothetical protein
MRRKPINRKLSMLFALTRSVLKIIVRTSWPCAVPNPVRSTTPTHPPSGGALASLPLRGVGTVPGSSAEAVTAWRTFVPEKSTAFRCVPSASSRSDGSSSAVLSFSSGVLSPDSMASFTMHVPLSKRMSAGMLVSVDWRTDEMSASSVGAERRERTDGDNVAWYEVRRLQRCPLAATHALDRVGCDGHGAELRKCAKTLHDHDQNNSTLRIR